MLRYHLLLNDIFYLLLGDNKMISFSPNSRYTAQKIADKVANGAYFYSHFAVESDMTLFSENIEALIQKLTDKYFLNLTPRQRTYRLNTKKEPIADLIVQKRKAVDAVTIFDFYLLITTPETHSYNDEKERAEQQIVKQRVKELKTPINRQFEQDQVILIQKYFNDHEKFKFVLTKPFLTLKMVGVDIELVRLSHSTKSSVKHASKKSKKGYTWTWRYNEVSMSNIKKVYIKHLNDLISSSDKSIAIQRLKALYKSLRFASVFKGTRHQIGKIFVDMLRYHKNKTTHDFKKMDYYVELKLNYLPRLETYADSFRVYVIMRLLDEEHNKKVKKEDVAKNFDKYAQEVTL